MDIGSYLESRLANAHVRHGRSIRSSDGIVMAAAVVRELINDSMGTKHRYVQRLLLQHQVGHH